MSEIIDNRDRTLISLSTNELIDKLQQGVSTTVETMRQMAEIVRILDERGVDLSAYRHFPVQQLRRIAYGQTTPEVVVKFQAAPLLLSRITALPLPDQQRLARGGKVRVLTETDEGIDFREVDPLDLSRNEIHQVFAASEFRTDAQQRSQLMSPKSRSRRIVKDESGVVVNHRLGGIEVNGKFLSKSELIKYLARLEDK